MIKFLSTSLPSAVTASRSCSPLFRHSNAFSLSSLFKAEIAVSLSSVRSYWISSSIIHNIMSFELITKINSVYSFILNVYCTFIYIQSFHTFFVIIIIVFVFFLLTIEIIILNQLLLLSSRILYYFIIKLAILRYEFNLNV